MSSSHLRINSTLYDFPFIFSLKGTEPCLSLQQFLLFTGKHLGDAIRSHSRYKFSSVLFSPSVVSDSAIPWTAACQASLSITNTQSLLKLMSIEFVMPSNQCILIPYWSTNPLRLVLILLLLHLINDKIKAPDLDRGNGQCMWESESESRSTHLSLSRLWTSVQCWFLCHPFHCPASPIFSFAVSNLVFHFWLQSFAFFITDFTKFLNTHWILIYCFLLIPKRKQEGNKFSLAVTRSKTRI